jgi:hypothetical protein
MTGLRRPARGAVRHFRAEDFTFVRNQGQQRLEHGFVGGLPAHAPARVRFHEQRVGGIREQKDHGHPGLVRANTSKDCGFAVVRDTAAHRAAMTITADYISAQGDARDPIEWTAVPTR